MGILSWVSPNPRNPQGIFIRSGGGQSARTPAEGDYSIHKVPLNVHKVNSGKGKIATTLVLCPVVAHEWFSDFAFTGAQADSIYMLFANKE